MIFDMHSDLLFNFLEKRKKGETNIFNKYHKDDFETGKIIGGIWCLYTPKYVDLDKLTDEIIDEINLIDEPIDIVLGFESLMSLNDLDQLDRLYKKGFKVASITWNEENKYGTGCKGSINRGLTDEGVKLVKKMQELNMVIDLAHANEKTFYDVASIANKNEVIVSHANCKTLCDNPRNLTDDQLYKIKELNGVVGVVNIKPFIGNDLETQNIDYLVKHINYIVMLIGIDHVGLGFDFVDYLGSNANIDSLKNHSMAYDIVTKLKEQGYSDLDIDKITYKNIQRILYNE